MIFIKKFWKNESAATAIEYGLIAALIVIAAMAGIVNLGSNQKDRYDKVDDAISGATR
ncbi:Flp family type IVb pilin [Sphingorhabdus sp.]|uniref:Flp family type IVb pilin n=1 Tax=Sphingorhabdus sp. TaxID=1902408 RepID=UPI0039193228